MWDMRKLVRYQFLNLCLRHHTTPTPPLKRRGLLKNSLSYTGCTVIIDQHDQSKILPPNPPIFADLGPVRFLSLNTVKFVKFMAR